MQCLPLGCRRAVELVELRPCETCHSCRYLAVLVCPLVALLRECRESSPPPCSLERLPVESAIRSPPHRRVPRLHQSREPEVCVGTACLYREPSSSVSRTPPSTRLLSSWPTTCDCVAASWRRLSLGAPTCGRVRAPGSKVEVDVHDRHAQAVLGMSPVPPDITDGTAARGDCREDACAPHGETPQYHVAPSASPPAAQARALREEFNRAQNHLTGISIDSQRRRRRTQDNYRCSQRCRFRLTSTFSQDNNRFRFSMKQLHINPKMLIFILGCWSLFHFTQSFQFVESSFQS